MTRTLSILLLLLAGCATKPAAPVSPAAQLASSSIAAPPAVHYLLAWDYPFDLAGITFEVWHSTNLSSFTWSGGTSIPSGFTLLTNTAASSIPFPTGRDRDFFIVRAVNAAGPSDWSK